MFSIGVGFCLPSPEISSFLFTLKLMRRKSKKVLQSYFCGWDQGNSHMYKSCKVAVYVFLESKDCLKLDINNTLTYIKIASMI